MMNTFSPPDAGDGMSLPEGPASTIPTPKHEERRRTVLVVEDDIQSQQYMKILLTKNYGVEVSSSAKDAWEKLKSVAIDLVLMDISLHGDIDGLQLTRIIRDSDAHAELPIIALTAHAFPADRQKSIDAGCTDYISKPFQRDQLLRLIEKYIGR